MYCHKLHIVGFNFCFTAGKLLLFLNMFEILPFLVRLQKFKNTLN